MSTPIVNNIIERIEILLNTVTEIKQVAMYPRIPIDNAKTLRPYCAVRVDPEGYAKRNMLEINSIAITMATIFECKEDRENIMLRAYEYDAAIHYALFNDSSLADLCEDIVRETPEFEYVSETDGYVISRYVLTYMHKYGDPYNRNF